MSIYKFNLFFPFDVVSPPNPSLYSIVFVNGFKSETDSIAVPFVSSTMGEPGRAGDPISELDWENLFNVENTDDREHVSCSPDGKIMKSFVDECTACRQP